MPLQNPGSANTTVLSDLTDIGTVVPTDNHVLIGDGSDFDSRALVAADISDVVEGSEIFFKLVPDADALPAPGDGKFYFPVPASLNLHNLISVVTSISTVSSSGLVTVAIRRDRGGSVVDMLSTSCTIDEGEKTSLTAATAVVINSSNDDLATGDWLIFDLDAAGTGAKGLGIYLKTQK